ncbi:MAG: AarF/UbiB family protein, partial [bacterium]
IKGAQYLSHRPDLISAGMIKKIQHLRDTTPMHSFRDTLEILVKNGLFERIEHIEEKAFASGIIGQVYRAKLKDIEGDVIIKVRHPNVMKKLHQGGIY